MALLDQPHPVDRGEFLVELAPEARKELLTLLTPGEIAEILEHIEPEEAVEISEGIDGRALSQILDETSPDVAGILKQLPAQKSLEILEAMEEVEEVTPLLRYPDDIAGGLMASDDEPRLSLWW